MEVGFARQARDLLTEAGLDVEYHEGDGAHHIDPAHAAAAAGVAGPHAVAPVASCPGPR